MSYIFQILNYTQAMNLHTMEAVLLFQNCTHPLLRLKTQNLSTNVINSAKWHSNVLILNMSQVAPSQCHTVPSNLRKVGFNDFLEPTLPYARHYNLLLIWNHSWILTIHKVRISQKNLLKKTVWYFKNGVKSIQTAGCNGVHTVYNHIWKYIPNSPFQVQVLNCVICILLA